MIKRQGTKWAPVPAQDNISEEINEEDDSHKSFAEMAAREGGMESPISEIKKLPDDDDMRPQNLTKISERVEDD